MQYYATIKRKRTFIKKSTKKTIFGDFYRLFNLIITVIINKYLNNITFLNQPWTFLLTYFTHNYTNEEVGLRLHMSTVTWPLKGNILALIFIRYRSQMRRYYQLKDRCLNWLFIGNASPTYNFYLVRETPPVTHIFWVVPLITFLIWWPTT